MEIFRFYPLLLKIRAQILRHFLGERRRDHPLPFFNNLFSFTDEILNLP